MVIDFTLFYSIAESFNICLTLLCCQRFIGFHSMLKEHQCVFYSKGTALAQNLGRGGPLGTPSQMVTRFRRRI